MDPSSGSGDSAILRPLRMARYRFVATVLEDMVLPPYKGSAFRGGFGGAFRRICCTCGKAACNGCVVMETCPYAYVFETRVPAGSDRLRNIEDIPRPFIMEPPEDPATLLKAGSLMRFNVVLTGRGIDFLPYFILAFRELGDMGLGRAAGSMGRRARFRLEAVDLAGFPPGTSAKQVYDAETGTVRPQAAVTADDLARHALALGGRDTLRVRFATPTRLKFNHQYVANPDFHVLVRALLRRLSSLLYFHHGADMAVDYKAVITAAEQVRVTGARVKWIDWTRYSSRQEERMVLGGITGEVEYQGDIEPFLPLLVAGTFSHVGKNVTFGLGRYDLVV